MDLVGLVRLRLAMRQRTVKAVVGLHDLVAVRSDQAAQSQLHYPPMPSRHLRHPTAR